MGEAARFAAAGLTAAAIDFGVYYLLFAYAGVVVSKAVSYITATVYTFILNKLWTFGAKKYTASEIPRFLALYAVSMIINNIVNKSILTITHDKLAGFIAATVICAAVNFSGLKYFVFIDKGSSKI